MLCCHKRNDPAVSIKTDSSVRHFKFHELSGQNSQDSIFESKLNQTEVCLLTSLHSTLLLSQTASQVLVSMYTNLTVPEWLQKKEDKKVKKGREKKKKKLLGTSTAVQKTTTIVVNMANTEFMRVDQKATTACISMSAKKACVQQRHDCIEKLTCIQKKGVRRRGYT